ncbi:hypothetical protein ID866_6986 [Astraeus odoratus]|nr:hypothetical protein ID866_6986 [Astraeus odoratus]
MTAERRTMVSLGLTLWIVNLSQSHR